MKIEPGYWRCRNGSRARVLCTDAPGDYPVVGYVILPSGNIELCQWTSTGGFWFSHEESRCDLIEPWREPVRVSGWVVWAPETVPKFFYIRDLAEAYVKSNPLRERVAAIIYVTGVEGVVPTPEGVGPEGDDQ